MIQSYVHERTSVHFGRGAIERLERVIDPAWGKLAVITTRRATGVDAIWSVLASQHQLEVDHVNVVRANPDVADLEVALPRIRNVDAIVAIGGGSVLDASKALAVIARSDESPSWWLDRPTIDDGRPSLPLIAIPTTFGTGSELSRGAILSDRSRGIKRGLRGASLIPSAALVDPALADGSPASLTARTGFDVITHAFESLVSRRATPASRGLSWVALQLVGRHLPDAVRDGRPEARDALAYASLLMGINLANVGTCLPHRMQYAIGGRFPDTSHPQGLAWLYPAWIEELWSVRAADVVTLVEALGASTPTSGVDAAVSIREWLSDLGVSTQPSVTADPAQLALALEGNLDSDPLPEPSSAAGSILEEVFG